MSSEPTSQAPLPQRLGKGMITLALILVLGLLTLFFNDWLEDKRNPNQQVQSRITGEGVHEVVLQRNSQGHYVATGYINEQPVEFFLDTGATDVSIPASVALHLGLAQGVPLLSETANGTITVYATVLENIKLGSIVLQEVQANINPHMEGEDILLGMSFLKHLEFTQRGNTLTLKEYAP